MRKIAMALSIMALTFGLVACGGQEKSKEISSRDSFIIKTGNESYEMYDTKGNKVNSYTYINASNVVKGSAAVTNLDKKVGIVDADGKRLVDFGKYQEIEQIGAIYKATKDDKTVLLDCLGRKFKTLKNEDSVEVIKDSSIVIFKSNKEISILDEFGESLADFDLDKNSKLTTQVRNDLLVVHCNSRETIYNLKNDNKEIVGFDSKNPYYIYRSRDEKKEGVQIILSNKEIVNSNVEGENTAVELADMEYKFVNAGQVTFKTGSKYSTLSFDNNYLIAEDNETLVAVILDYEGKKLLDTTQKVFYNEDTYIEYKKDDPTAVRFIKNGKKVKTIECAAIKVNVNPVNEGIYIIDSVDSAKCGTTVGKSYFYNSEGKRLFKKEFKKAEFFDANSLAQVSDDGKEFYLINTKGKQIGDKYNKVTKISDDYYAGFKDNKVYAFDRKGKVILEGEYKSIEYLETNGKRYLYATTKEGAGSLYSLESKKIIINDAKGIRLNDKYFQSNGENPKYYALNGKELK